MFKGMQQEQTIDWISRRMQLLSTTTCNENQNNYQQTKNVTYESMNLLLNSFKFFTGSFSGLLATSVR